MLIEDAFRILGLSSDASYDEVKASYRLAVQAWHPDKFKRGSDTAKRAEKKLQELNAAYAELKAYFESGRKERDQSESKPQESESAPVSVFECHASSSDPRVGTKSSKSVRLYSGPSGIILEYSAQFQIAYEARLISAARDSTLDVYTQLGRNASFRGTYHIADRPRRVELSVLDPEEVSDEPWYIYLDFPSEWHRKVFVKHFLAQMGWQNASEVMRQRRADRQKQAAQAQRAAAERRKQERKKEQERQREAQRKENDRQKAAERERRASLSKRQLWFEDHMGLIIITIYSLLILILIVAGVIANRGDALDSVDGQKVIGSEQDTSDLGESGPAVSSKHDTRPVSEGSPRLQADRFASSEGMRSAIHIVRNADNYQSQGSFAVYPRKVSSKKHVNNIYLVIDQHNGAYNPSINDLDVELQAESFASRDEFKLSDFDHRLDRKNEYKVSELWIEFDKICDRCLLVVTSTELDETHSFELRFDEPLQNERFE